VTRVFALMSGADAG